MRFRPRRSKKYKGKGFAYLPKRLSNGTWVWLEPFRRSNIHGNLPDNSHLLAKQVLLEAPQRYPLLADCSDPGFGERFELAYNPIIDVATERIAGFRAAPRVKGRRRANGSHLLPNEPEVLVAFGSWMIRRVCAQTAAWSPDSRISVDVSPFWLAPQKLAEAVFAAIAENGATPDKLELVFNERLFAEWEANDVATLRRLRNRGTRIAVDCSASTYPPLHPLGKMRFDSIELMAAMIGDSGAHDDFRTAWLAFVELMAALGSSVTTRGVETADELVLVREAGCTLAEGPIFGPPATAAGAAALLARSGGRLHVAGCPRAREPRIVTFRKIGVHHAGNCYEGVVRNLSSRGAMIDGLWDVAPGAGLRLQFDQELELTATCRWASGNRMGVEFEQALDVRRAQTTPGFVPPGGWIMDGRRRPSTG